jgi:seryl-tRNA synthetase
VEEVRKIKSRLAKMKEEEEMIKIDLAREARLIPNHTHPDVPIGEESEARLIRTFGPESHESKRSKDHLSICEELDLADFDAARVVSGSKFVYLKNEAARMELALSSWAMDEAMRLGFTPVSCPDLVRDEIVDSCGFAPRSDEASQIYTVRDTDLSLVGTAEIPLGGMLSNRVFESESQLPCRMVGLSHCFRTEAGSAGKESKGLYRLHQFTKVELFAVSTPEESDNVLEELCTFQQHLYEQLGLRCRVLDMPTQELGSSAYRKYDIEAWMPSRGGFGEISSASNCTDYQSRRLNIKFQRDGRKYYAHTLNATAVAVPRVLMALLETGNDGTGRVEIPKVLRPYMGGLDCISRL